MSNITLSADQQTAWDDVTRFLNNDQTEHALGGAAGTGKTLLTGQVVRHLDAIGMPYTLTATTNKAARVAASMAGQERKTIHSLLGLKPTEDHRTGRVTLERNKPHQVRDESLILIDEASMVSRDLLDHIREAANDAGAKVLYVGDAYQLPPVGEVSSPVFERVSGQSHLITVHRQALENPLIATATEIRGVLDGRPFPEIEDAHGVTGGIVVQDREAWRDAALEMFASSDYAADPDHCRMLGWTNSFVREANTRIRRHVVGPQADSLPYLPGEQMVNNTALEEGSQIVLGTDEAVQVLEAYPDDLDGVSGWRLKVNGVENGVVRVFCPDSWDMVRQILSVLAGKARVFQGKVNALRMADKPIPNALDIDRRVAWCEYFRVRKQFCDLRPPYASTVHKSQGSTYKNVFIQLANIGQCNSPTDLARLLYVGITRPRSTAYCTGAMPLWVGRVNRVGGAA